MLGSSVNSDVVHINICQSNLHAPEDEDPEELWILVHFQKEGMNLSNQPVTFSSFVPLCFSVCLFCFFLPMN